MVTTTVKSGEARIRWRDLLDQVLTGKGDVVIERNGKNVAVMIPAADYEQIREKLETLRAVREAAATYEVRKSQALINTEAGTATIPLEMYNKLVVERDARFAVIREIQENAPDLPEEEVEKDVMEAIERVRAKYDSSGS
ncbi:MAG: type II toxin-antitoxin system Phd/YefM family antitoxin [Anaerolineales bacterium]|nr:type II toxin-antitoxin system Phd/YefM family antitoxin [Anaerolineales bacterium]